MIELLQFFDMIRYQEIYLLVLFFLFFAVLPAVWIKIKSKKYQPVSSENTCPITVIVPVYNENHDIFNRCLESIWKQKPDQIIVSKDGNDEKLLEIAQKYGTEIVRFHEPAGKRNALATAWDQARNDIIVHVDSDVILQDDCLREISKPFVDKSVAAVSASFRSMKSGSALAHAFSSLITKTMVINGQALNGQLIVADGKCSAWRKDFLLKVKSRFLNDIWLGQRSEIGDDRFLTREVYKAGYKVMYQNTAVVYVPSPEKFNDFINQQIRWRRSGVKFFIKDLTEGIRPSPLYFFKCFTYYLAPFAFILAVVLDFMYFHLITTSSFNWWLYLILLFPSIIFITAIRQSIYHGLPPTPKYLPLQAILGLFLILPISIFGTVTAYSQQQWLTRSNSNRSPLWSIPILFLIITTVFLFIATPVMACWWWWWPPPEYC